MSIQDVEWFPLDIVTSAVYMVITDGSMEEKRKKERLDRQIERMNIKKEKKE